MLTPAVSGVSRPPPGKESSMERSGVTPAGAVTAADLAELAVAQGPFLTVELTTEGGIDNAAYRSEQRWKTLRTELQESGAPEEVLAVVDPLVGDAHLHGEWLGVLATAQGQTHVEHADPAPPRDRGSWAPLPVLLPFLARRQSSPPYVAVRADRRGADIVAVRRDRPDLHRQAGGGDDPLAKAAPGGWSQRRYQQRAENTWEHNADDVAAEVTRLAHYVDARLVVVAGDTRAVTMIGDALPPDVAEILQVVEGSRSADGSEDVFVEEVERAVTAAVDADTEALLGKFREELGQSDRATEGIEATVASLARAQVEVLLVADSDRPAAAEERSAWFGPVPTQLGLSAQELRDLGVGTPQEAPLLDVVVRAALGTSAGIRLVPGDAGVAEGLGSILRWSA